MAKDITGQPWIFDAVNQGEGRSMGPTLGINRHGTFTVDNATDIFTMAGHGLSTGSSPWVEEGGTLPAGMAEQTDYFVYRIDANTFYLYTTHAAAIAGGASVTTNRLNVTDNGTTPNYILMQPYFDHKIYIRTIVVTGDGSNEGTVDVRDGQNGRELARVEVSDKDTGQFAAITPVHSYVEGIWIQTLDATNAKVLVYHGEV